MVTPSPKEDSGDSSGENKKQEIYKLHSDQSSTTNLVSRLKVTDIVSYSNEKVSGENDIIPKMDSCNHILHLLTNPKCDHFEREKSRIFTVTLYIKSIEEESLQVIFEESKLTVVLRSSDVRILKQYPLLKQYDNHFLLWKLHLRGQIIPANSTFCLKSHNLEIKLYKAADGNWGSLEASDLKKKLAQDVQNETWIPFGKNEKEVANLTIFDPSEEKHITSFSCEQISVDSQLVKMGYTGLMNMGNSCYLNA